MVELAEGGAEEWDAQLLDSGVEGSTPVLVQFYASECMACRAIAADYDEAARLLWPAAVLARAHAQRLARLAEAFDVRAPFPKYVLLRGSVRSPYASFSIPPDGAAAIVRALGDSLKRNSTGPALHGVRSIDGLRDMEERVSRGRYLLLMLSAPWCAKCERCAATGRGACGPSRPPCPPALLCLPLSRPSPRPRPRRVEKAMQHASALLGTRFRSVELGIADASRRGVGEMAARLGLRRLPSLYVVCGSAGWELAPEAEASSHSLVAHMSAW